MNGCVAYTIFISFSVSYVECQISLIFSLLFLEPYIIESTSFKSQKKPKEYLFQHLHFKNMETKPRDIK